MRNGVKDMFCHDLPTKPQSDMGKILITGGSGYIGGKLIPELLARGYNVRVMLRELLPELKDKWPKVEFVVGDAFDIEALRKALEGIDTTYYLIHSLLMGNNKFQAADTQASINFRETAEENNVRRIIYLGGLGDPKASLSAHLESRIQVAQELQKGKVPVTVLRASIVVGTGSVSYDMINNLIKNCPIFLIPRRAKARCQPISIRDVIKYLVGTLETKETCGKSYDIGGSDIITYEKILRIHANIIRKKRLFIPAFFLPIKFYSYIVNLLTPIALPMIMALMESSRNDAVCQNNNIKKIIKFEPLDYKKSVICTFEKTPPTRSQGLISDVKYFFVSKPNISTLIKFDTNSERKNYTKRLMQRIGIDVDKYKILNIHSIGIDVPLKYVFEELLNWNGDSTCWPNYIAKVERVDNCLEDINIFLLGIKKYPFGIKKGLFGFNFIPLFNLKINKFQEFPDPTDFDNARYLLYNSSGGYPIGIFYFYVRSSIDDQNEVEQTQLFMGAGFNFYGKKYRRNINIINKIWEFVHNRVTGNVMNRVKQLCEWKFDKMQKGIDD